MTRQSILCVIITLAGVVACKLHPASETQLASADAGALFPANQEAMAHCAANPGNPVRKECQPHNFLVSMPCHTLFNPWVVNGDGPNAGRSAYMPDVWAFDEYLRTYHSPSGETGLPYNFPGMRGRERLLTYADTKGQGLDFSVIDSLVLKMPFGWPKWTWLDPTTTRIVPVIYTIQFQDNVATKRSWWIAYRPYFNPTVLDSIGREQSRLLQIWRRSDEARIRRSEICVPVASIDPGTLGGQTIVGSFPSLLKLAEAHPQPDSHREFISIVGADNAGINLVGNEPPKSCDAQSEDCTVQFGKSLMDGGLLHVNWPAVADNDQSIRVRVAESGKPSPSGHAGAVVRLLPTGGFSIDPMP